MYDPLHAPVRRNDPGSRIRPSSIAILFFVTGALLAAQPPLAQATGGGDRPNIVLLLADDLGYGDLGCYGREDIQTPHLDRLAEQGVRFTNYYANGPECTPTRVALLTGRYQQWVGGLECAIGTGNVGRYDDAERLRETHDLGLPTETPTIAGMLKQRGYRTAITGKWHLGYESKFAPHLHGFDHTFYCIGGGMDYFHYLDNVAGYNLFRDGNPISGDRYFTDMMTDEAIACIDRWADAPFFLYVPFTAPHTPYQGPDDRRRDPLPLDSPLWNQSRAPEDVYIAMIERVDESVGRILDTLDRQNLASRTVVIFASDNGGTRSARNNPLSGHKGTTYEGGIRVPAIVRWPGVIKPNSVSHQPCITMDLTASIARVAGARPPKDHPFDGIDILDHVVTSNETIERTLYWRKPRGETIWMGVRHGDLKYVARQRGDSFEEHLFDLASDISETNDLAGERPEDLASLRDWYRRWESTTRQNRRGRPGWLP